MNNYFRKIGEPDRHRIALRICDALIRNMYANNPGTGRKRTVGSVCDNVFVEDIAILMPWKSAAIPEKYLRKKGTGAMSCRAAYRKQRLFTHHFFHAYL